MSIIKVVTGCLCVFFIQSLFAEPPFEVLRSCIDEKPKNSSVSLLEINNGYYQPQVEDKCENQYEIKFKKKIFGTVTCNETPYLLINNQKIDLTKAVNKSANPEIKPGILYPTDTSWLKIDFKNQSFLCLNGPISLSGTGSNIGQYYIVENAFSDNSKPIIYFYFLNKDIAPLTSAHL